MNKLLLIHLLIPLFFISCKNETVEKAVTLEKNTNKNIEIVEETISKKNALKNIIKKTSLISLPWSSNNEDLRKNYPTIDMSTSDSLCFDDVVYLIGLLPDTSESYIFLHFKIGDDLIPSIKSFDKKGNAITDEVLILGYCGGYICSYDSCNSNVSIDEDLNVNLEYYFSYKKMDSNCNPIDSKVTIEHKQSNGLITKKGLLKLSN